MELVTYKVTFKETADEWLFQYRKSDGLIYSFHNIKGQRIISLLQKQQFPEDLKMIEQWSQLKKLLTIELVLDDYSFDTLWEKYDVKIKKDAAQKAFEKLSLVDKIKCFNIIPAYKAHLLKSSQNPAHLVTFINQKRYNDEYKS